MVFVAEMWKEGNEEMSKKDRRGARVKKREEEDRQAHELHDNLKHWVAGLHKVGGDITVWYAMDYVDCRLPSFPRSKASCAAMSPEEK